MSASNDTAQNLHGFVLIGGASSRMGRDKAQMVIGGQKLFERTVAALRAVCPHRITLVGKVGSDFDSDLLVIGDVFVGATDNIRAPIVGVYAGLLHANTPWIVVLVCDLPFVTGDLMTKLAGYCSNEFDAVVPVQTDARP
jgi:molybdopterin-guanine dinucleotide biosynthesis protein A